MGIIKKQAIQSTFFNYLGVAVGFLNSTILMPNLISKEDIGLLGFLNSTTVIFSTIFALGVPLITVKVFPKFREEAGIRHNGFFSFSFLMTLAGFVIGLITYLLLESSLIDEKNEAGLFAPFWIGFTVLFAFRLVFKNFDTYIRMLYNTVLGAVTENLLAKLVLTVALIAYWYMEGYGFIYLFILYILGLSIPGLVSLVYIIYKKGFRIDLLRFRRASEGMGREIKMLGLYGLLGSMGTIIVLEVDRVMISNMLGLAENGIYTTVFFFGIFVSIPSKSIKRVAIVVVSDSWKANDLKTINSVYSKSCINQFLLAIYLFLGVWLNIDFVLGFIPVEYTAGKYVILFIGIGQLFDMLAGVNTEIISTSKYFRFNTYFVGGLIFLVIVLNYMLIPLFGINGAAMATGLSVVVVNVLRYVFLYRQFNFQPLNFKTLVACLIGVLCFFIVSNVPILENNLLNIIVRGFLLTLLFWVLAIWWQVSVDINTTLNNVWIGIQRKIE